MTKSLVMKKIILTIIAALLAAPPAFSQQIVSSTNGEITFFSEAPIENIEAVSRSLNSVLNTETNDILFVVSIRSFEFEKEGIKEHFLKKKEEFNNKYMESDKYPTATFNGTISGAVDYSKDGVYEVTATGKLKIHGVEQPRTEQGTILVKDGIISLSGQFTVSLKNFNVEIPKLLTQNIAETVKVTYNVTYNPFENK